MKIIKALRFSRFRIMKNQEDQAYYFKWGSQILKASEEKIKAIPLKTSRNIDIMFPHFSSKICCYQKIPVQISDFIIHQNRIGFVSSYCDGKPVAYFAESEKMEKINPLEISFFIGRMSYE